MILISPADAQEDPGVWRLKTARDFSYRPSIALSKPSEDDSHWFQRVYLGLWRPRVYLWGANENSRLAAVPGVDVNRFSSVPAPADATPSFKAPPPKYPADSLAADGEESEKVEGECRERIVDLQTGGWSYTARDAKGGVWVWGELAVRFATDIRYTLGRARRLVRRLGESTHTRRQGNPHTAAVPRRVRCMRTQPPACPRLGQPHLGAEELGTGEHDSFLPS